MNTIILNGSPRKNWNTAMLLKADELVSIFSSLNGTVELYPACDTLQVQDYSRYSMAGFNEEHKQEMRKEQFPRDLEKAFQMGAKLAG